MGLTFLDKLCRIKENGRLCAYESFVSYVRRCSLSYRGAEECLFLMTILLKAHRGRSYAVYGFPI